MFKPDLHWTGVLFYNPSIGFGHVKKRLGPNSNFRVILYYT